MTNNELIQNILSIPTESRTMEFKRLGSRNDGVDKTLQSIVAMANTDGGTIILGVDDPQKTTLKGLNRIFGIEENIELYDEIGRSVRKIYPPISGIWPPKLIDGGNGKRIEFILEKTGLARKDDSKNLLPTRAAVLLFAEFPNDLLETKCSVRVFQVQGNRETITRETLNWIGTPKNINGPIAKQITDAHEYVLGLLKAGMRVPSGFRTTYSIPERAVKEAITNAVIHRDYHTKRDIEIRIFEDRIEVESPGLLPFNITPSNIGIERSHQYRNDLLVKHLREFPDPPNLDQNEGVRAMRQTMKTANLYPPIFFTYPNLQDAVRVVLLNEKAPNEWDKVSDYLIKNKYITNTEARGILLTEDTVKVSKRFNRWVKQGLLTKITPRTGAKRNVRYRLPTADERSLFTSDKSK